VSISCKPASEDLLFGAGIMEEKTPRFDVRHISQNALQEKQGAPTLLLSVFIGLIEVEDFRCHRRDKVSKCVTSTSIFNCQFFCISFFIFFVR
jgi:hypothetical protein